MLRSKASWIGFHRNGVLLVLFFDWLWSIMEFSAGATLIGIPAIPFIAFVLFAIAFRVVYVKQRSLGDSQAVATGKAMLLAFIAGVPTPVLYTGISILFAVANRIMPDTRGISVKFPSNEHLNIGKFTSEYRETELLLKEVVKQHGGDLKQCYNINECIKFLSKEKIIEKTTIKDLHQVRKIRNNYNHTEASVIPDIMHFRILRKCKEEIELIVEKGSKNEGNR